MGFVLTIFVLYIRNRRPGNLVSIFIVNTVQLKRHVRQFNKEKLH